MEIILEKPMFRNLGKTLDVVKVKDGYAQQLRVPAQARTRATAKAKKKSETESRSNGSPVQKELGMPAALRDKLAQVTVNLRRRVVEGNASYGSVSAADIAEAITQQGGRLPCNQIILAERVKQLGVYTVTANVFGDVRSSGLAVKED